MTDPSLLGMSMAAEMNEQPAVLFRLSSRLGPIADEIRTAVGSEVRGVAFLARGSSDNAALVGRYAIEACTALPTCLVAPSLVTAYGHQPSGFAGWLVVAISQSGETPEIVDLTGRFRDAGASVVAITNDGSSSLAEQAQVCIDLDAGPEKAVPATKTVTAQMLAMLAVVQGLTSSPLPDVQPLGDEAEQILADEAGLPAAAAMLARHRRMVVVARGLCYPAAKETALKLQETTGALAHGFSTADFRHGPIAVCGPDAPAVLVAGSGPADQDTVSLIPDLRSRGAAIVHIGTQATADITFPIRSGIEECVLATIRGQQLALAMCRSLDVDPDSPGGLNKVTLTH